MGLLLKTVVDVNLKVYRVVILFLVFLLLFLVRILDVDASGDFG